MWREPKLIKLKVMFPEDVEKPRTVKQRTPFSKKMAIIYGLAVALCLVVIVALLIATDTFSSSVSVPSSITQKVKSGIYMPSKLPGNYKIDEQSFKFVDEDSVLIFQAEDGVSGNLVFSEQAKPKDFDFDNFHKGNFEDPKTLSNAPYTSVWGKSVDGRVALSIVTEDTWIIMATSAPLSQEDMQLIASGVRKR